MKHLTTASCGMQSDSDRLIKRHSNMDNAELAGMALHDIRTS